MTSHSIAIAGATGNLGPALIHALLNTSPPHKLTILSRSSSLPPSLSSFASKVSVTQVDYTSHTSLVSAFKGHDVFLSLVPDHGMQPKLFDAAIEAGVQRIIPSEFGVNVAENAKVAALPVFSTGKVPTQKYLREKAAEGKLSYTIIATGAFLDWGIETGFVLTLKGSDEGVRDGKCKIWDGGDYPRSMTLLRDIGKAVVGVLRNWDETANRAVYVQSCAVSQLELLGMARKRGVEVEVEDVSLSELEKKCYNTLSRKDRGEDVSDADFGEAMFGFVTVGCWKQGYGTCWGERNDNALLGIKELSKEQLEEVVGKYVKA